MTERACSTVLSPPEPSRGRRLKDKGKNRSRSPTKETDKTFISWKSQLSINPARSRQEKTSQLVSNAVSHLPSSIISIFTLPENPQQPSSTRSATSHHPVNPEIKISPSADRQMPFIVPSSIISTSLLSHVLLHNLLLLRHRLQRRICRYHLPNTGDINSVLEPVFSCVLVV